MFGVARRIDHVSLTEVVYLALVQAISDDTFPPGSPVSIDGLAARLGISITPVREALVQAASLQLLVRESNKGYRVVPSLTPAEYYELLGVRRTIEIYAIEHVRLTSEGAERLAKIDDRLQLLTRGRTRGPDPRDFGAADREFHTELVAMSGDSFAFGTWNQQHHHLHIGRLIAGQRRIDLGEAIAEHRDIVRAAQAGDTSALVEAACTHVMREQQRIARLLPTATKERSKVLDE
jgi:DNA-binding GntR family transcriptional regulator